MLVMICYVSYKSLFFTSQVIATHTPLLAFVRCQAAEFLIPGTCSDEHSLMHGPTFETKLIHLCVCVSVYNIYYIYICICI